jgi:cytochrome c oxidase cbb3-type subunit 4
VKSILAQAATTTDLGWLMGVMTVLFLLFFAGWVWWAFAPRNRARHEAASMIPFDDSEV